MTLEENKATVRRWFDEFWNAGNLAVADELFHPNYVSGDRDPDDERSVVETSKEGYAFWHGVFPDLHFAVDEVIAEGDTVVVRWTGQGTHQGDWATPIGTIPASGKATRTPGTSTYHLKDGKIIWDANHIDFISTLQQIGAVVQPGEPGS